MIAFYMLLVGVALGFAIGWAMNSAALDLEAKHDRLYLEGKCINHTNKTPHAPRRPNGRRCDSCCALRRKVVAS